MELEEIMVWISGSSWSYVFIPLCPPHDGGPRPHTWAFKHTVCVCEGAGGVQCLQGNLTYR